MSELSPEAAYVDWPGLDPYDDGVYRVLPVVEEFSPDLVLLGGEYLLPPALASVDVPVGLIYNPEIFDPGERNLRPAGLFAAMFSHCDFLLSMGPVDRCGYLPEGESAARLAIAQGPFMPRLRWQRRRSSSARGTGVSVVIANGGGVDFPTRADSYSSHEVEPAEWLLETIAMTSASVKAALSSSEREDRIQVFSCLDSEINAGLAGLEGECPVTVESPNVNYYEAIADAHVVVSRTGAGFLVDASAVSARIVGWALANHDEQLANLRFLTANRPRSWACADEQTANGAIAEAMVAARGDIGWCDRADRHDETSVNRTEIAAERLVEMAMGRLGEKGLV